MQTCRVFCLVSALATLSVAGACDSGEPVCGAFSPGDVVVGITLPCHHKVKAVQERIKPESFHCSDFDIPSFVRALATIHELEQVNAAGFLPGVRLGYLMCDTCSYASKALQNVEQMLAVNRSLNMMCNYTNFRPPIKIILGALYSEESIAMARLMNVYMVPLLSSTSSSPELSDKDRYPVFMRTVPSDKHQTKAVAKLMNRYGWTWVGVVYGDDEYGKGAFQSFANNAQDNNLCMAYQEVLPNYLDSINTNQYVKKVAEKISSSSAKVVLLILKAELVELLFQEMIRTNTSRTWIASDAWSRSWYLAQMKDINKVGDILGFTFVADYSESFDNYLKNLTAPPGGYNRFIEEYKNLRFNCTPECISGKPPSYCPSSDDLKIKSPKACTVSDPQAQNDDYLLTAMDTNETFVHRIGVWTAAHAIKKLLLCDSNSCPGERNFPPWQLLTELKKVKFTLRNQNFFFDENGDFENGYDLVMWEKKGEHRGFNRIGRYNAQNEEIEIDVANVTWISTGNTTIPKSRCSETCGPGFVKKIQNVSCCYTCAACPAGFYSDSSDLSDCKKCDNSSWSASGARECKNKPETFLQWSEPHPVVIIIATVFGFLALISILIIFLVYRNSPPVKRAELRLSCVMMVGLAVSFGSVVCFTGKPNTHLCRARQVMYGMGFTLCMSCILVKAYRTFLAFLPFGQITNRHLHRLYKPPAIIIVMTLLQGIICLLWMLLDSPDIKSTPTDTKIIIHCKEGETYIGFAIMLGYIALLAFVGFILAFKGRRVPQEFSETSNIIFSMLTYLFVWMCFIPVYLTVHITNPENGPAVQASAILISNFGIILCHFLPKCYQALWGSKKDSLERIERTSRVSVHSIDSEMAEEKMKTHSRTLYSPASMSTLQSPTHSDVFIIPTCNNNVYPLSNGLEALAIRHRGKSRSNSF